MKIVLVETEDEERPSCADSLAGHAVEFVEDIGAVPRDAEFASAVIHSRVGAGFYRRYPRVKRVVSRSSVSDHLDPKSVARRAVGLLAIGKTFGMDCVVFDREADAAVAGPTGFRCLCLDKLLRCSGLVTLPVLHNPRTRHLLARQNVFFTPQVGFNGIEAIGWINRGKVQSIRDFLAGRPGPETEVAP